MTVCVVSLDLGLRSGAVVPRGGQNRYCSMNGSVCWLVGLSHLHWCFTGCFCVGLA